MQKLIEGSPLRSVLILFLVLTLALLLNGCSSDNSSLQDDSGNDHSTSQNSDQPETGIDGFDSEEALDSDDSSLESKPLKDSQLQEGDNDKMSLTIDGTEVQVKWESNDSVKALQDLCSGEPLQIQLSKYGGFEQVGPLGSSLPTNNEQITTQPGDIVLYNGDQIVIFYGSNSWSYTKLGQIIDQSQENLTELLGNGNVTVVISDVN